MRPVLNPHPEEPAEALATAGVSKDESRVSRAFIGPSSFEKAIENI
jgi:hypothetical protein